MTRSEYSTKLSEAKVQAIIKWQRIANNSNSGFNCTLCNLVTELNLSCSDKPICCPINDFTDDDYFENEKDCCKEYFYWVNTKTKKIKKEWALRLVKRLEAIDVEAWSDYMVENKFITND